MKRWISLTMCAAVALFLAALGLSQVPASFLRSNLIIGSGTAQSSSGLVLVEEHTASNSASLAFTTCFTSTYDDYMVKLVGLIPATDNSSMDLQVSTNGGSSYDTGSNYAWTQWGWVTGGEAVMGSDADTSIHLTDTIINSSGHYSGAGEFGIAAPLSGANYPLIQGIVNSLTAGNFAGGFRAKGVTLGATYLSTTAVNAFKILASSGNITSGTVRCYGLSK